MHQSVKQNLSESGSQSVSLSVRLSVIQWATPLVGELVSKWASQYNVFVGQSTCLSPSRPVSTSLHVSPHVFQVCLSVHLCLCLAVGLSINVSDQPSVSLSVYWTCLKLSTSIRLTGIQVGKEFKPMAAFKECLLPGKDNCIVYRRLSYIRCPYCFIFYCFYCALCSQWPWLIDENGYETRQISLLYIFFLFWPWPLTKHKVVCY